MKWKRLSLWRRKVRSLAFTETSSSIHRTAFPPSEAATLDKLRYRQENAPELFLGAFTWLPPTPRRLVGYICSTASAEKTLTHNAMSQHDEEGKTVCIHSVVVHSTLQGRGLAVDMLKVYLERLREKSYDRVNLIAHENLIGLYQRAGFELTGRSEVEHGPEPWFELTTGLREAGKRNPGVPFTAYASRPGVLVAEARSAADFYCPRRQCRSLILRRGSTAWSDGVDISPVRCSCVSVLLVILTWAQLLDPQAAPTPAPPDFPPADGTSTSAPCWRVLPPSPMTFENISVSKAVPGAPGRKYLGCADCDCGPLGWLDADEAVLDARRLRYRLSS